MSKTTIVLFVFLVLFVGVLLYITYGPQKHSFITSLSVPIRSVVAPVTTNLSFSTSTQLLQPRQTGTIAVLIHNPDPHPTLAQLEIAYDPAMLTVDSIAPGPFFTNPTIALQNIDPYAGRISYALRCPSSNTAKDCVNTGSPTVAVITVTANSYALKRATTLSFLPKTVVRTQNGHDILQSTVKLELSIGNVLYPISSSSAVASPGANVAHVSPIH